MKSWFIFDLVRLLQDSTSSPRQRECPGLSRGPRSLALLTLVQETAAHSCSTATHQLSYKAHQDADLACAGCIGRV